MIDNPGPGPGPDQSFVTKKIERVQRGSSSGEGRPKPAVDKKESGMNYSGIVRRKDPVQTYGEFHQLKFFVQFHDTHTNHNAMFDAVHREAFDVGDTIHFSAELTPDGWFKVQKKHKIFNETRAKGGGANMAMRPVEEIRKLHEKATKAYDEVCGILNQEFYKIRSEEAVCLKEEKYKLELLIAYLHFVQFGVPHPDQRFRLTNFKSCTICSRHFGDKDWPLQRILDQSKNRLTVIQKEVQGYQNSEEYVYLYMLYVALAWTFDQMKDAQIGMQYSWRMFSRKIKDDFQLRGQERDEWNTEERRPLEEKAAKVITELEDKKQDMRLKQKFSFLKDQKDK